MADRSLEAVGRRRLQARPTVTLETANDWVVSRAGSIAVADIAVGGQFVFTAVSVYAAWEKVLGRGCADGFAHGSCPTCPCPQWTGGCG